MQKLKSTIDHQPSRYQLKPIPGGKLQESLQQAGLKRNAPLQIPLKHIIKETVTSRNTLTRFLVHTREEIRVILVEDVVCCVADSNYTFIHLKDGSKVMVSKTLKEVERILCLPHFFRTHASNLINLFFIKRILKVNQFRVELSNLMTLDVSRSRREELVKRMETL